MNKSLKMKKLFYLGKKRSDKYRDNLGSIVVYMKIDQICILSVVNSLLAPTHF
jgi:hypothetical protein